MPHARHLIPVSLWLAAAAACSSNPASAPVDGPSASAVIAIDGSSTVYPVTEAVAEAFQKADASRRVTVGASGTGGGFKKFCAGEVAITGASRPIKQSEIDLCAQKGIQFVEIPVAYDGLAVVVHPDNTWVSSLTVEQLKAMWSPAAQGTVTAWNQIDATWPTGELHLFGAGVDSGTYDYFTKAVVGEEHSSRGDFTSSEDDNVLVQGVSTDPNALGFMGLAYYEENAAKLKLVPIDDGNADNGAGPIAPTAATVLDGTYQPLSRPIFIYADVAALARPEVAAFVDAYLSAEGRGLVKEVGYIPLGESTYTLVQKRVADRVAGTAFHGGSEVGVHLDVLLGAAAPAEAAPAPAEAAPVPPPTDVVPDAPPAAE